MQDVSIQMMGDAGDLFLFLLSQLVVLHVCSAQAGIALIRRAAFVADPAELAELTLPVLARDDGAEFSFSSGSLIDDTDGSFSNLSSFSLLLDVDARSFDGSRIDADTRRWCIGALIVLGVEPARAAEGPDGMRVGVAVADELRLREGV